MTQTIEITEAVKRLCEEYMINKNNQVTSTEMSKIKRYYYDMLTHLKSVQERYDEQINLIKKQEVLNFLTQMSVCHPPFNVLIDR
jgi:hypothetical protein